MDRYWLLTWTTYGTWLPGDDRGFVSNIDSGDGTGVRINKPQSQPAAKLRGFQIRAREKMSGPPVYLSHELAAPLLEQFQETTTFRGWELLAVAIMSNHVHLLVGVAGDPEPSTLLRDFKSYGSRRLNRLAGKPQSGTWWTEGGSVRKKSDERAIRAAIEYIMSQANPLLTWRAGGVSPLFRCDDPEETETGG